jgi:hypothetical protein
MNHTWWDTGVSAPSLANLMAYDVVLVGNRTPWSESAASAVAVGNVLADYIDAGGKVIDTNFIHDYFVSTYTWYLEGDYIDLNYGPFTQSTAENGGPNTLNVVDSSHPVMSGVTAITENILVVNVGLQPGASLLATWSCGYNAIAVSADEQVVGINMTVYGDADNTGNAGVLIHNSVVWLHGT